jgi:hypothetical protein
MTTYAIDDAHGNQLTTGLDERIARDTAERMANDLDEAVYLYDDRPLADDEDALPTEKILPEQDEMAKGAR